MRLSKAVLPTAAAFSLALGGLFLVGQQFLTAADHVDAPTRTDPTVDSTPDIAADIADIYVWYTDANVILALTTAGPRPPGEPAYYDRDVLYALNVSNDGDPATTEFPIEIRFGQDGNKNGVQVTGLPGGVTISGPVETRLERSGILVQAGLFDDPFFFDSQGFRETRATGTLSFSTQRNFFAGKNVTAIIIQIPRSMIQNGNKLLNVWSSTARFGGQL